jgi:hypothetical protein
MIGYQRITARLRRWSMPITEGVVYCDGCGVEVEGAPVVKQGLRYCCITCAEGGECDCGAEEEDQRSAGTPEAAVA